MEKSSIGKMVAIVVFIMATVIGTSLWSYLSPAYAATVSIDGAVEYQTIYGFGGAESWRLPSSDYYDEIFDDLGVSVLRFQMFAYTESTPDLPGDKSRDNDNGDPAVIDWNGVNVNIIDALGPLLQAAQSRKVKIIGTTWSPPAWMKSNNLVENGATQAFVTGNEAEMAEFITIWVKGLKNRWGVNVDSVTIQNEPDYNPVSYAGCTYTDTQYENVINALGARFASEGITTTEIHAPDTMTLYSLENTYDEMCANGYVDSLASHNYGISGQNLSPDNTIPYWQAAHTYASGCGKDLWETEYGDIGYTWPNAFNRPQHIHNALVYGHVSAYHIYEIYKAAAGGDEVIQNDGTFTKQAYLLKQYYRYVRPGAIRVYAISSDGDILVTAFKNYSDRTFTVVAINRDTLAETVSFNLSNLNPISSLNVYRTSVTENSVDLGSTSVSANSFTYTLPSESVTTFTGVEVGGPPSPPTNLTIIY